MSTLNKQLAKLERRDLPDAKCWTALAEILRQFMLSQGVDLDAEFEQEVKEKEGNDGY